jgi:hypothetical protein
LRERILNKLRRVYRERNGLGKGLIKSLDLVNISIIDFNNKIRESIINNTPLLVSRFGSEELKWYLDNKISQRNRFMQYYKYVTHEIDEYNVNGTIDNMTFLPRKNHEMTKAYIELIDLTIPKIDVLGTWLRNEQSKILRFNGNCNFIRLRHLEPFWHNKPWSLALKGKKVLIISPFAETIVSQYTKRHTLFKNVQILPEFDLITLKSPYFDDEPFKSWLDIYNYLLAKISNIHYDVAILGCGSWGMPLAGKIKDNGKVSIHLGGATQLLFGIYGNRWKNVDEYAKLINNNWVKGSTSVDKGWFKNYDNASYW